MIRARAGGQRGFTLLEVMIALAILAGGLTVLIHRTAANIQLAQRDKMLGVVADLARAKMYDMEELLREEGFQETEQELDGDFSEEGWEQVEWEAKIEKIELPNLESMKQMGEEGEGEGEGGESESGGGMLGGGGMFGGMLGMAGGVGDGAGDGGMGAGLISSQYEIFRQIMEQSIRKVTLTLTWRAGGFDEELVVNCYFTEPAAISRVIMGGGAAAGGGGEGDGEGEAESPDDRGGSGGSSGGGGRRGRVR